MTDQLASHSARFEADPDAAGSFEWLEETHFLAEDWEALVSCYQHRLTASSLKARPAQRAQLNLRLGQLLEDRIEDSTGAILAYRECVSLEPTLRAAWERLRALYSARGSWTAVLQVAELELEQTEEASAQATLLREMARIWSEALGDDEQAATLLTQADTLAPDATPAESVDAPESDALPLVQRAWLAAARGDSTTAIAALREAIEIDPSDVEAIDMLATVLEGAERHSETADLLERRAALAADDETRAAVLSRLGVVRETQLGDSDGACDAHRRALTADPRNAASRASLSRLYRSSERWSELRESLEAFCSADSVTLSPESLCELGELLVNQFDEPAEASEVYQRALAIDPNMERAQQALAALEAIASKANGADDSDLADDNDQDPSEENENRSVRVVGVLERKLSRLQDEGSDFDPSAVKLRLRIAELRGSTLGDVEGAIELLAPCIGDPESLLEVAQRLGFLYERAGRHEELIELARRAAESAVDAEERAGWYRRAAETARATGDSETAVAFYHCLLGERPTDRNAEAALLELHRARGEAGALVPMLQAELTRASLREELPLQLELADLLEEALENPEAALPHWRRALALDPTQVEALDRALRCANSEGGAVRQLDLLEHLASNAPDEVSRARLLARRGDLMVDRLGWVEEGAANWQNSLAIDPNQPGVRSRLESIPHSPGA